MKLICKKFSVNPLNYVSDSIYVAVSQEKGRGVFTKTELKKNTVIEIAKIDIEKGQKLQLIKDYFQ